MFRQAEGHYVHSLKQQIYIFVSCDFFFLHEKFQWLSVRQFLEISDSEAEQWLLFITAMLVIHDVFVDLMLLLLSMEWPKLMDSTACKD